ncbi:hypothetical protein EVAR_41877_1 [Eumeta japonica]|uniref:Transmembrane protein n=1 Tax=Eumeta variegata TaxID=151549 RepID=A0A4C1XDD0_EUMVA|nr:hypothetical protein EVAR_41877_1 [Eumeta japonica]
MAYFAVSYKIHQVNTSFSKALFALSLGCPIFDERVSPPCTRVLLLRPTRLHTSSRHITRVPRWSLVPFLWVSMMPSTCQHRHLYQRRIKRSKSINSILALMIIFVTGMVTTDVTAPDFCQDGVEGFETKLLKSVEELATHSVSLSNRDTWTVVRTDS